MALSPNYGWAEPDNSSLVKNGAQDIRALGDAIDTSVWNVGYGQAGKNKIINGNFGINQRAFSSTTSASTFMFDRWQTAITGDGTSTFSAQTFTPGTAPVAGYESRNYLRIVTASQTTTAVRTNFIQRIEDVRTFAGQTVTLSFWAKASSGTPSIAVNFSQNFGTGGSSQVDENGTKFAITTSWARYSVTTNIPSISGKTIGDSSFLVPRIWVSAGSDFNTFTNSLGIQSNTFEFWGVQVEYGSKATPFQTASGGSPQAELAMCQRYYWRATAAATANRLGLGYNNSTTQMFNFVQFPVEMRIAPTALEQSGTASDYTIAANLVVTTCSAVPLFQTCSKWNATSEFTVASGLIAGQAAAVRAANTNAFLGWSAEL